MKPFIVLLSIAALLSFPGVSIGQGPDDLFATGHVRLVQELCVTDKDLPENALFQNPRSVAIDSRGSVYVSDFDANHIKVFNPNGKFLKTIGRQGQGPGDLSGPSCIEISGERIVVWEAMNRRFSILDMKGALIRTAKGVHGPQGDLLRLKALPDGRFVAFVEKGLPEGFQGRLPEERHYAVLLLTADLEVKTAIFEQKIANRRWTRHPETKGLIQIGFPYHPRIDADISLQGMVAIGLNQSYDIGLFDPDKGRIAAASRPYTPIKLEERDKQDHFSQFRMVVFTEGEKRIVNRAPDYFVKGTEFPDVLPPYRNLIFDGRGRLWVQVFTPERATNVFDIFDAAGRFLNRITIEGAAVDANFASAFEKRFAGDSLWKIERDADGFASLVKYRLSSAK